MRLARLSRMKLLYSSLTYAATASALITGFVFLVTTLTAPDQSAEATAPQALPTSVAAMASPDPAPAADRKPVWLVPTAKYEYTPPPARKPAVQATRSDNSASKRSAAPRRHAANARKRLATQTAANETGGQALGFAAAPQRRDSSPFFRD